jgi:hypothetical protein
MRTPSRRERLFLIAFLAALTGLATGCNSLSRVDSSTIRTAQTMGQAYQNARGDGPASAGQDLPPARNPDSPARPGAARQMVYSARFDIATSNVEDALGRFIRGAESVGGYLETREDARVVCRVPAARFQEIVAGMTALGSIVSQAIRNDDVTRKYRDLRLHLETAECSRQRVLGLLQKAEKLEDIIKLEEELLKLTAAIEGLKGTLEDLSEQIAYSRVEVLFRARVPETRLGRPDACSPFAWINQVGAEQVTETFGPVESNATGVSRVATLLPGGLAIGPLEGFLMVKSNRAELKAIAPDASKLWVREFTVPQRSNLKFWSDALRTDLVDHRGYQLLGETRVRDGKGNEGVEMVCDVVVQGQPHRYMLSLYAPDAPFWHRGSAVRTIEFVAPVATFDRCAAAVRKACGQSRASDRSEHSAGPAE